MVVAVPMYAVIKTGGKQYRVAKDEVISVEKLVGEAGTSLDLGEVLMIGDDKGTTIGSPLIEGASVSAEVVEQARNDKIIVFKKKRRKNYRRKKGHRQDVTLLRITDINAPGAKRAVRSATGKTPKEEDEIPAEVVEDAKAVEAEAGSSKAKAKPERTTKTKNKTPAKSKATASKTKSSASKAKGSGAKTVAGPKSTTTRSQSKKTEDDDKDSS